MHRPCERTAGIHTKGLATAERWQGRAVWRAKHWWGDSEGGHVPRAVSPGSRSQAMQNHAASSPAATQPAQKSPQSVWETRLNEPGDCVREETFCFTELIFFPQNHSQQRLSSLPALLRSAANQARVGISTALLQSPRGPAFPRKPAIGETGIHKAFCSESALAAGTPAGKKRSRCGARGPALRRTPLAGPAGWAARDGIQKITRNPAKTHIIAFIQRS